MTRAVWNGAVIAESDDTIVVDGYTYFPRADVVEEHLTESDHMSVCHSKGTASYFSLVVGGKTNKDAAWHYPHPEPGAVEVRGRVGFWRGVKIQNSRNAGEPGADRKQWWRRNPSAAVGASESTASPVVAVLDDVTFPDGTIGAWTLVDFYARWCGPCRQFQPVFEAFAEAHADRARFARCDVDANPETAFSLGIASIPTLVLFDVDGNEAGRVTGVPRRRDLEQLIDLAGSKTAIHEP